MSKIRKGHCCLPEQWQLLRNCETKNDNNHIKTYQNISINFIEVENKIYNRGLSYSYTSKGFLTFLLNHNTYSSFFSLSFRSSSSHILNPSPPTISYLNTHSNIFTPFHPSSFYPHSKSINTTSSIPTSTTSPFFHPFHSPLPL